MACMQPRLTGACAGHRGLARVRDTGMRRVCAQEEDWRARESAILALGAISEGCAAGLLGHLAEMVRARPHCSL